MLKFIKQIFNPPPLVHVVDFCDGLLCFRAKEKIPLSSLRVRTQFPAVNPALKVTSYDENLQIYRAVVEDGCADQLTQMDLGRRESRRLPRVMRVLSHQIPGFFCSSEDISMGGMRLATSKRLSIGQVLQLQVDLDDANLEPLKLSAEVRWSARKADGSYHSGLEFRGLNMDPSTRDVLERFIEERLNLEL